MNNLQPRRRSIFGGLLLVLLGVYFLAGNLNPEWRLWDAFGRYWPVLLILWGLAKLVDHLSARSAGQAPPRTLTVGEFFLVLFLVLLGGAYTATRNLPWADWGVDVPWLEAYRYSDEITQTAVPADARIVARNERGDIDVRAEDVTELQVLVRKTGRFSSEAEARRWADSVEVQITENEQGYLIRPRVQERRESPFRVRHHGAVHLEIIVPRQASVRAETRVGDVRLLGITGAAVAETQNGNLEVRDASGGLEARTAGRTTISNVRGDVRLRGRGGPIEISDVAGAVTLEGNFYGPIVVRNASEGVRFVSARTNLTTGPLPGRLELTGGRLELAGTPGDVKLVTRNYDIMLEDVGGRIEVENRNGKVELRLAQPPRNEIQVRNERGHVELVLPAGAGFEIRASARRGEIESEFTGPNLRLTEDDRLAQLQGQIGRGPQLRLDTTYGTILLRKGG